MAYKPSSEVFDDYLAELIRGNLAECLVESRLRAMVKYLKSKQADLASASIPCPILDESVRQMEAMKEGVNLEALGVIQRDLDDALDAAYGQMLDQRQSSRT